ncbi:uncharacterized protein L201_000180 [Kwoniella dendrophila CBS 6074]|uniref:Uncharacterized protein n=1 Tax=Kwoniella dendrophila CBS 6074 TaxID=1295534 RepID=A0AAX4JLM8_9TREE
MGSSSSSKISENEIPLSARVRSKYGLYILLKYPECYTRSPKPLWTGSYDQLIHEEPTPTSTLYGWGYSKGFNKKEVDTFIQGIKSREPDIQVKYKIVGPQW